MGNYWKTCFMLSLQVLVCCGLWRLGAQRAQILTMGYFFFKDGSLEGSFGSLKSWILPGPTVVTA